LSLRSVAAQVHKTAATVRKVATTVRRTAVRRAAATVQRIASLTFPEAWFSTASSALYSEHAASLTR